MNLEDIVGSLRDRQESDEVRKWQTVPCDGIMNKNSADSQEAKSGVIYVKK